MVKETKLEKRLAEIVTARDKIWSEYDAAVTEAGKLKHYSQFDVPQVTALPSALTSSQTPPDEIAAVLWELKQKSDQIAQEQNNITNYSQQIQETKKQFFIVVGGAIAFLLLMLFILIVSIN